MTTRTSATPSSGPGRTSEPAQTDGVLLEVRDLAVDFGEAHNRARVVEDVSFDLAAGETLGLVGESGSGKTVTSLAALGMIEPPHGRVVAGSIRINGREILGLPRRELTRIRGREIAMVFQEPRRSLDPAFTVGDQIAETVRAHLGVGRRDSWKRAVDMLDRVGIPSAARRAHDYPHQFSGGMAQRAMLAIALSCSPKILIADEPTTALDVTVQAHVLDLIRDLQVEFKLAVLFVSHDLGVIAEMCDRVAVMYAGQMVEQASVGDLFLKPRHPYTAALLESIPRRGTNGVRMSAIPGVVPSARSWPSGCRFHPRCQHAIERCQTEVPSQVGVSSARCLREHELTLGGVQ